MSALRNAGYRYSNSIRRGMKNVVTNVGNCWIGRILRKTHLFSPKEHKHIQLHEFSETTMMI